MAYSKAKIFNLALGALLLQRQISDTDNDASNEAAVLNTHWDAAFNSTLQDMDLDSTSTQAILALIEEDPTDDWGYAYTYPSDCVFLRRIQSSVRIDSRSTHIEKRIAIHEGQKVIFTDQTDAVAEYISNDVPISSLSASVGLAIAYQLAILSSPLIVGKGAQKLRDDLEKRYIVLKADAQKQDRAENFNFVDEDIDSEFVQARTE